MLKVTKQIYCISLNMLDRRQSRVLEINRYSICIFFFLPPPSVPITTPPVRHVRHDGSRHLCRQNELIDAIAMGGLVDPERKRDSES